MGAPPAVLLDEPTRGLDVASKQAVWRYVAACAAAGGSAVLLATHAMDEVDAACTTAAVLAGGRLRTVGRVPALKAAYGSAYTLQLSADPRARPDEVARFVTGLFRKGRAQEGARDGAGGYTYQVRGENIYYSSTGLMKLQ
eukprot:994767-Prorocentrum_minimum.AAC.1